MTIVLVIRLMAKYGQYGHIWVKIAKLAIFGHKPYYQNYGHDVYPWKDNKRIRSPVKKQSDLDVWVKSYDQKTDFYFWKKIQFFQKSKLAQKSTFLPHNQNSETTFISSTFKVEEIKVVSEF